MNQMSQTILNSSSTHLFNELNFKFKFDSLGSWTKFNKSIIESNLKPFSSWFGSLSTLNVILEVEKWWQFQISMIFFFLQKNV